jgi:hypothetical protein
MKHLGTLNLKKAGPISHALVTREGCDILILFWVQNTNITSLTDIQI